MSINIRDANEVNLFTGATLNAAGTTDGGAVELDADATNVTFVLTSATAGGTSPTLDVELQVSSDNFVNDIRSLGAFTQVTTAPDTRYFDAFIPGVPGEPGDPQLLQGARWVRAANVELGGTSPDFTGSTLFPRIAGYGRNDPDRTA